jgi:hypothetical protein
MSRTLVLALALAAAPATARVGHPPVRAGDAAEACEACHAKTTPAVVQEWAAGRHGLLLVKCFVCHGSTGKDFALRVGADRCAGCHPAEVASSAAILPAKAGRGAGGAGCFSCHSPHSLAASGDRPAPHTAK